MINNNTNIAKNNMKSHTSNDLMKILMMTITTAKAMAITATTIKITIRTRTTTATDFNNSITKKKKNDQNVGSVFRVCDFTLVSDTGRPRRRRVVLKQSISIPPGTLPASRSLTVTDT